MVDECDQYKLWFRQDSVFLAPRGTISGDIVFTWIQFSMWMLCVAYVHLLFRSAVHLESPQTYVMAFNAWCSLHMCVCVWGGGVCSAVMMDIFLNLMKTLVGEVAYAADVAQLW